MPPSIKVNTKRPKVLFQQKVSSNKINHDLMGPHHTRTTTTSTTATITTAVTTSLRTPHQKVSRPRSGKGPRSRAAVDELTATPGKQDRIIMDPVGIGKTSDIEWDTMLGVDQNGYFIPDLFTSLPPLQDTLETKTSRVQDETVQECLPLLAGIHDPSRSLFDFNSHGLPRLEREKHIKYLHSCLNELPARFVVHDASRPWILYWVLAGLCLLGEDVQQYRSRVVQTLSPMQNLDGGFGGGHGQTSHCAPTWRWLGHLKQHDGGFVVCVGGEEDVRGAYCSMVLISLLALPLELPSSAPSKIHGLHSFLDGLPEYLSRCQTFEGGISGAPQNEAHGGYAFCALACLCILGPPHQMIPKYLDVSILISWLSARQYAPEGGFAGRTNKLVDGCYSHWVGGCWPLLEAAVRNPQSNAGLIKTFNSGSFFSREGLIRYILCCCQAENGGLRDKPLTHADAYHSCYSLTGLSAMQNRSYFPVAGEEEGSSPLDSALRWALLPEMPKTKEEDEEEIFDADDRVAPTHPIYLIPWDKVEQTHMFFAHKGGF
ncbi:CAAX farnesyltransferase (FTase) subunit beta [Lobaria immixta]|nr:CAAX farnesyltransferase (FTase) subunit beta [Lobaria immixta]